jgi:hypothetical protein
MERPATPAKSPADTPVNLIHHMLDLARELVFVHRKSRRDYQIVPDIQAPLDRFLCLMDNERDTHVSLVSQRIIPEKRPALLACNAMRNVSQSVSQSVSPNASHGSDTEVVLSKAICLDALALWQKNYFTQEQLQTLIPLFEDHQKRIVFQLSCWGRRPIDPLSGLPMPLWLSKEDIGNFNYNKFFRDLMAAIQMLQPQEHVERVDANRVDRVDANRVDANRVDRADADGASAHKRPRIN